MTFLSSRGDKFCRPHVQNPIKQYIGEHSFIWLGAKGFLCGGLCMAILDFIKADVTESRVVEPEELDAFAADEALQRLLKASAQRLKDNFYRCDEFEPINI